MFYLFYPVLLSIDFVFIQITKMNMKKCHLYGSYLTYQNILKILWGFNLLLWGGLGICYFKCIIESHKWMSQVGYPSASSTIHDGSPKFKLVIVSLLLEPTQSP